MNREYQAVKLTDRVYWVGAVDYRLREFHGYSTTRGTTYNAYLIRGDKTVLIDTVKKNFMNEMLSRIASVIEPARIDYVVSNHAEMDHSGSLPDVIPMISPEKIFASSMGVKALKEQFNWNVAVTPVKTGDSLDFGGGRLQFIETRMLHWPDSMVSYFPEEGVLFSQDAFGLHLATDQRFEDEVSWDVVRHESAKYFANILVPYSKQVLNVLKTLKESKLDIRWIANDHGPIWRKDVHRIMDLYEQWSLRKKLSGAVVVFDTMWGSTAMMAGSIAGGLADRGLDVKIQKLGETHRSDVATELLEAAAIAVGSPTINGTLYPTVADALTYIRGLRFSNLIGGAFGSYGWGGEAVKQIGESLTGMDISVVAELKVKYVPDKAALADCHAMGMKIAEELTGGLE